MNRRKMLGWLVGAPVAVAAGAVAAKSALAAPALEVQAGNLTVDPILGEARQVFSHYEPARLVSGAHTHTLSQADLPAHTHQLSDYITGYAVAATAVIKTVIWTGHKWVDAMAPEGQAFIAAMQRQSA